MLGVRSDRWIWMEELLTEAAFESLLLRKDLLRDKALECLGDGTRGRCYGYMRSDEVWPGAGGCEHGTR